MAGSPERKLPTTRLSSLLIGRSTDPQPTSPRSPRSFDGGPVGLRIVAAMAGDPPARSEPVPIVSARPTAMWGKPNSREELELSESYTCVISHAGGKPATKRVYFNGGDRGEQFEPPMPARLALPQPAVAGFLSRCYLCRKMLHGLDIFMYRGDQAFCSVECRFHQILNDERMEMCGSEAMKQSSISPCSPFLFAVGVAAA